MRQTRVIRYGVGGVLLLLSAACANFHGMRTSMPPPPAEAAPGTAAPAPAATATPAPAPAPAGDLAQRVQDLEVRVQQLESRLPEREAPKKAPAAAKERPLPAPPTASSPKPAVSSAAAEKSYTEGMRLYHAKKFAEARNQLHRYLQSQPRGPKAPEARYYLADSFYQEAKYREAGVEFNKLRVQFPKSILAPAGLLRQALCYKSQQQLSLYRSTLKKLVKAYPNTPEAKEAQKMLKEGPKEASR